jgi:hypothetical protein
MRGRMVAIGLALCMVAVCGAGSTASAGSGGPSPEPPIPGLLTGHIEPDPLQVALEADLESFIGQDFDKMVDDGCVGALDNYWAGVHYDDVLRQVFDNLSDIDRQMARTKLITAGVIAARGTQAIAETYLFVTGASAGKALTQALGNLLTKLQAGTSAAERATDSFKAVKAGLDAIIAGVKDWAQWFALPSNWHLSSTSWSDRFSAFLNFVGTAKATLSLLAEGSTLEKFLSLPEVGTVRRALSIFKAGYDSYQDLQKYKKDHKGEMDEFLDAWLQYTTLLRQLQGAVQAMRDGVTACKPVPQPTLSSIPAGGLTQSRCAPMSGPHTVSLGKDITFSAGDKNDDACYGGVSWTWPAMTGLALEKPCAATSHTCTYRAMTPTGGYVVGCINGGSGFGGWVSCDYYVVLPVNASVVQGWVTNADGSPVAGVLVRVSGTGETHSSGEAITGPDGYFATSVLVGTYAVDPIGVANISPESTSASVGEGDVATAKFFEQSGTDVTLTFDQPRVSADGLSIVDGTVTTKTWGTYGSSQDISQGNVQVQLRAMPSLPAQDATTDAPLATICQAGGGRLWPTGGLTAPIGDPIPITTDATGQYKFAITVGTRPGTWQLRAWAFNTNDQLALDPAHASTTASVDFTKLATGSLSEPSFVSELRELVRTGAAGGALAGDLVNPGALAPLLGQLSSERGPDYTGLEGLAFALVNGKDGQAVLVYPSDQPPPIEEKTGAISASARDVNDLVWSPGEWDSSKVPQKDSDYLNALLDKSFKFAVPTFEQWKTGSRVLGWKTVKGNVATVASTNFQYFGWAYPGINNSAACY